MAAEHLNPDGATVSSAPHAIVEDPAAPSEQTPPGEEREQSAPAGEPEAPTGPAGDPPPEQSDPEAEVEHDLEELTAKAEKADEYLELAQRTKADFENYRRRAARDAAA